MPKSLRQHLHHARDDEAFGRLADAAMAGSPQRAFVSPSMSPFL
ncbi:MAG: hypothetical protein QOG62_806, partial [Thermoleophilaceae bacterium]|nr:hypothetical protein [Thermoleophilaceae bacterium]